jgi:transcriptional regulator with XRE-family HTH domain
MDKKAIGDRLKAVILSHGLTQKGFAAKVGFSDKYISDIVRGRTKPSLALLQRIRSVFNVSLEWLIAGIETPKAGLGVVGESVASYYPISGTAGKSEKVALPLLSEGEILDICATGIGIDTKRTEEYFLFCKEWLSQPDKTVCVTVKGTEMEPLLKEGSVVALNIGVRDPALLVGRICGIRVEGEGICFRWLRAVEPYLVFMPQREGYPPLCLPVERNPIIGRVEGALVRF